MEPPIPDPGFIRELRIIDPDLGAYFDFEREGWYIQKRRGWGTQQEHTTLCLVAPDGLHYQLVREVGYAAQGRADPVRRQHGSKRRAGEMAAWKRRQEFRSRIGEQAEREADVMRGRRFHAMGAPGAPAVSPIVAQTERQRWHDIIPPDAR